MSSRLHVIAAALESDEKQEEALNFYIGLATEEEESEEVIQKMTNQLK